MSLVEVPSKWSGYWLSGQSDTNASEYAQMPRIEHLARVFGSRPAEPVVAAPVQGKAGRVWQPRLEDVDPHLVSLVAPESAEAEQYRALRYEVEHLHEDGRNAAVCVCSPLAGEGKTMTSVNLAGSLAQDAGAKVLLVEVDLRRPSIGARLGLGDVAERGLADAILDPGLTLGEVVCHMPHFNVSVLPAGKRPRAPYELLKSPRFGELLTEARKRFDFLILDAPPVISVPDCRLIAHWVDGFFMVVAAHRTPKEALDEALTLMPPSSVLGLVFNGYDHSSGRYY
jgi:capsular exopolysaccharide synthesis family protein